MIKILIETIAEVVAKNQSQTEEILKWIKEQPEQSDPLQYMCNRLDAIDVSVQDVPNKVSMPRAEIMELKKELRAHLEQLAIPLKQEVKHEHHILDSFAGFVVSFLIIMGLSFLSYYAWMQADLHKENDIKYRYLKAFDPADDKRLLQVLDSVCTSDPDILRKIVVQKEELDRERFEEYQKLQETKKQEKDLQDKLNKSGK
jgi:hypothetical protein